MVDLLNQDLRTRDLRKLVEPYLHEVTWEFGVDRTSEWVLASLEDEVHANQLISWLLSKNVADDFKAIFTDTAWSDVSEVFWAQLLACPEKFFYTKHVLIVAADRSWVIEYAPQGIARFGRWV